MNGFLDLAERQITVSLKAQPSATEKRAFTRKDEQRDRLSAAYTAWRDERRKTLLTGPYGAAVAELVASRDNVRPADGATLFALVDQQGWRTTDTDTRFGIQVLIDAAFIDRRERYGLLPLDDALPNEPENAFLILREMLA
jgi:hypothetical protein